MQKYVAFLEVAMSFLALVAADRVGESKEPKQAPEVVQTVTEGYYASHGREGGKEYKGVVLIAKQEDGYLVLNAAGVTITSGCGVLRDNKLIVGWATQGGRGVTVYEVKGDTLTGKWNAIPAGSGEETLKFLTR